MRAVEQALGGARPDKTGAATPHITARVPPALLRDNPFPLRRRFYSASGALALAHPLRLGAEAGAPLWGCRVRLGGSGVRGAEAGRGPRWVPGLDAVV